MAEITLKLKQMRCDKREIEKDFSDTVVTVNNVRLKQDTSILNPTFRLANLEPVDNVNSNVVAYYRKFNYITCENLGRDYFITDIRFCSGGIVEIDCKVDVLSSYSRLILDSTQVITRAENLQSPLLVDDKLPFDNGTYTEIINIDCPHYFSNHLSYLLKLGGGYSGT